MSHFITQLRLFFITVSVLLFFLTSCATSQQSPKSAVFMPAADVSVPLRPGDLPAGRILLLEVSQGVFVFSKSNWSIVVERLTQAGEQADEKLQLRSRLQSDLSLCHAGETNEALPLVLCIEHLGWKARRDSKGIPYFLKSKRNSAPVL